MNELLVALALICQDREALWTKVENQKACVSKILICLNGSMSNSKLVECIK